MSARIAVAIGPELRIVIPAPAQDPAHLSLMPMRELRLLGESNLALRPMIERIHLQRCQRYFILLGLSSLIVAGLSATAISQYHHSLEASLGTGLFIGLCVMGAGLAGYAFCVPKPHWQAASIISPPSISLEARLIPSNHSLATSRTPHI
jgi:hypothetical protein